MRGFPDGIPEAILYNKILHTNPIEGDHGIHYDTIRKMDLKG